MLRAVAIAALFVVAAILLWRVLKYAEAAWMARRLKAMRRSFDAGAAGGFHRFAVGVGDTPVAERTWRDLDLDEVFQTLDFTVSQPGRQYLYHLLRTPHEDAERLARLDRVAHRLGEDTEAGQRAGRALRGLADPRAAHLALLIHGELPDRPRLWWCFPILTASAVASLALLPFWPPAWLTLTVTALLNVWAQVLYKPDVSRFAPALHEVPALVRCAAELGRLDEPELERECRLLAEGAARSHALQRASRWLTFEPDQTNEVVSTLYAYANMVLLFDVNAYAFSLSTIRAHRTRLVPMFEAIGYIDAARSIAAWRASLTRWCTPAFTPPAKALHAAQVVHPLVRDAVPNDLDVDGRSVLVSGSNMAGKTTFIRAVGINAILAQTMATACATAWRAPLLRVRTSIGRADSVMDGRSYYLAELESVRGLLDAKSDGAQHLFLLDETFRGTNTTERVAAAYAVLRHLDLGLDLVLVATHDLEVLDLLGDGYAALHFREQIVDQELTFDYRIRPGPSSTRNAIALLRVMDYPQAVIDDATAHLDWQQRLPPAIDSDNFV